LPVRQPSGFGHPVFPCCALTESLSSTQIRRAEDREWNWLKKDSSNGCPNSRG
jgi:hypothetical protein